MKKFLFIMVLGFLAITQSKGQDYQTGFGLRGGLGSGISIKHFFHPKGALETLVYFRNSGVGIAPMYESHFPIFGVEQLKMYFGGGAHIGIGYQEFVFGLDGIWGAEYTFPGAPICLALDWHPFFNMTGYYEKNHNNFYADSGAFTIRFVL